MFNWSLILVLSLSYNSTDPSRIPMGYLPPGSPSITILAVSGEPSGDYGQASRVLGGAYNDTVECRIILNQNSNVFYRTGVRTGVQRAAMVESLRDGTLANTRPKLFLLAHEMAHCFDNETLPHGADDGADGYRAWKEGYADAFAVLALKQLDTPESQFKQIAVFRENGLRGPYGKQWGSMISQAAAMDVKDLSDEKILALAAKIRRNTWESL